MTTDVCEPSSDFASTLLLLASTLSFAGWPKWTWDEDCKASKTLDGSRRQIPFASESESVANNIPTPMYDHVIVHLRHRMPIADLRNMNNAKPCSTLIL